jgi:hypothetical protein
MIILKTPRQGRELAMLHPTLWSVLLWSEPVWTERTGSRHLVVTCVWRSQDETNQLYAAAGLGAPAVSVHSTVKTLHDGSAAAGVDFGPERGRGQTGSHTGSGHSLTASSSPTSPLP